MKYEMLPIESVLLDKGNPRIKQYLEIYEGEVTSEGIALALSADVSGSSSYTALKESIKENGGIITPIIVNKTSDNTYVVIEGNTRLQIYKEFKEKDPNGPWNTIMSIVHDNLPEDQIHAIRLQAHMVGPREWDPFSKAKYLSELSNVEKLPLATIVSFCGGKKSEVRNLIDAYDDMKKYYVPAVEAKGYDINPQDFSKYAELQKPSVESALPKYGYDKNDFSDWVINGNIDTAQNVRRLPEVLKDPQARNIFLTQTISEALKHIHAKEKKNVLLKDISRDVLVKELTVRFRNIQFKEMQHLKDDITFAEEKNNIFDLWDELSEIIKGLESDE